MSSVEHHIIVDGDSRKSPLLVILLDNGLGQGRSHYAMLDYPIKGSVSS